MSSVPCNPSDAAVSAANKMFHDVMERINDGNPELCIAKNESMRAKSWDDIIARYEEQSEASWLMHREMYERKVFKPRLFATANSATDFFVSKVKEYLRDSINNSLKSSPSCGMVFLPIPFVVRKVKPDAVGAAISAVMADDGELCRWIQSVVDSYDTEFKSLISGPFRIFIQDRKKESFMMPVLGFVFAKKRPA